MTEVFVVAPANGTSGGPELCHQLVDTLNADEPGRAAIVYEPFDKPHAVPKPYQGYDVRPATVDKIVPGSTVVLPETYGRMVEEFPGCRVLFWWMSVNNFFRVAGRRGQSSAVELERVRANAAGHLYQSEYARRFLESMALGPARRLSDRLGDLYIHAATHLWTGERRDVVAFNPAKGLERSEKVLQALANGLREPPEVIALQGLTEEQMVRVLAGVKVYMDLGPHPGKDRLPREAAALGCCVITNRRGAAGNAVDVPIPGEFKIDDRPQRFERRVASKIRAVIADFDRQQTRFDAYRAKIAAEPAQFVADVRALFPVKVPV